MYFKNIFSVFAVLVLNSILLQSVYGQSNTFYKDYGPTQDWAKVDTASTLSQFVYHDINDNGVYDIGDIAMSVVKVLLERVDSDGNATRVKQTETNGIGFANFRTSATRKNVVIKEAGSYRFTVQTPPGWHVTSNNGAQTVRIAFRPETRSQLLLLDYMEPMGLAPDKWIGGTVTSDEPITLTLKNGQGDVVQSQTIEADQAFRFNVDRGEYQLDAGDISRRVTVYHLPVYIGGLVEKAQVSTSMRTASFEDLPQHGLYKIPAGYLGINWRDINALRRDFTEGTNEGYVNGVTSGKHVAYTSQSRHGQISSAQPFDFISVNLSSGWRAAEGQEVLIEMWRGEEQVVSDTLRLSILGPIKYAPHVTDVTRVRFTPVHGWQAVFDDLTIASCISVICKLKRSLN